MPSIALRLHPDQLANPSTDLQGALPELFRNRSGGLISDDGWGYVGEPPYMVVFLHTPDLEAGLACTLDVIEHHRVMENDLRAGCVVAVRRTDPGPDAGEWDGWEVVYPPDFTGEFAPWASSE